MNNDKAIFIKIKPIYNWLLITKSTFIKKIKEVFPNLKIKEREGIKLDKEQTRTIMAFLFTSTKNQKKKDFLLKKGHELDKFWEEQTKEIKKDKKEKEEVALKRKIREFRKQKVKFEVYPLIDCIGVYESDGKVVRFIKIFEEK